MNQTKKSQILENSLDNKLNITNSENDLDLNNKNNFKTEKKISKEIFNSVNSNLSMSYNNEKPKKIKHKKIDIFYKGKELINEEQKIGNLISNNGSEVLELSIIILYMNDSTLADENKIKEKLIDKIAEKCQFHKNNKELYICMTCGEAFCTHCSDKHENHEIIERKNIIKFNNELKTLNEELNKSLSESNLYNLYNIYEVKENHNINYNNRIDKLQNRLDNIKKIHRGIINNYKKDLDKILPYLLEYKEKIEQLIENSYKLDTIKDEQQFMDYYYWYTNIKQKNLKIKQEIENLEKNRYNFNKLLENFDEKLQNLYNKTEEDYKIIKNFYYNYNNNENENQFRNMNSTSNCSSNSNINISINYNNQNEPKLNLFNLLNSNNKNTINNEQNSNSRNKHNKEISKENQSYEIKSKTDNEDLLSKRSCIFSSENNKILKTTINNNNYNLLEKSNNKKHYSQRLNMKKFVNFEKIEEKSEIDESQEESNISYNKTIYNIKPNSQNIYYFDFDTRKVNEIAVNFNNLNIEYFEEYQSTLNYENNFYFSGGSHKSSKLFCKYNQDENMFIPLKSMPSGHSCHGMLGISNYIYIISGTKSKKVEKYDINSNIWVSLDELKESRIWPSCLQIQDNFIFVFGGKINKSSKEENILIEKLDISNVNNKWEQIKFNLNNNVKLPFYFGLLHINDNSFLLIGGNRSSEQNVNNCYKIIFDEEKIDLKINNEYKLIKKEEFNGKLFTKFKRYYSGEFSSLSYDTFYLVNTYNKTIKEIGL